MNNDLSGLIKQVARIAYVLEAAHDLELKSGRYQKKEQGTGEMVSTKEARQVVYDDAVKYIHMYLSSEKAHKSATARSQFKKSWKIAGLLHHRVEVGNPLIHSALRTPRGEGLWGLMGEEADK